MNRRVLWIAFASLYQIITATKDEDRPFVSPLASLKHHHAQQVLQHSDGGECEVSRMLAYDTLATGPVSMLDAISSSHLGPHMDTLNGTTGEQWEFDAVSADGTAGILIAFYRDPEFSFLGPGNLRINLDVTFTNGTMSSLSDYAEQSIIETCTDRVTGAWIRQGASYRFEVAKDMSTASVTMRGPNIKGTIRLRSRVSPRCADGSDFQSQSVASSAFNNIPGMNWMEPIPAAESSLRLTMGSSTLEFDNGIGGAERIWQSRTWFDMLMGYKFFRATVGPYSMSYWSSISRDEQPDGKLLEVGNVKLWHHGKPLWQSSQKRNSSIADIDAKDNGDYFVYRPTYSGDVRSGLGQLAQTGYDLSMVSPSRNQAWKFHFEHKQALFEFNLGRDAGGTAFMGIATGGQTDTNEKFEGVFLNEAVDFSSLWIPNIVVSSLWVFHYAKSQVMTRTRHIVDAILAYRM